MAKRLMVLVGMLAVLLATAVPALAQEGGAQDTAASQQYSVEEKTTTFELAVEGEPPADATFFGITPLVGGSVQLTDPDGDGLYTGTTTVEVTVNPDGTTQRAPVAIWGGIGTTPSGRFPGPPLPGYSSKVIKDFGPVVIEDGDTFSASVSFPDNGGSNGGGSGNGGSNPSDGSGNGNSGSSGSSASSGSGDIGETGGKSSSGPGGIRVLPATGGAPLAMLGSGILLIAGGLLARGILR